MNETKIDYLQKLKEIKEALEQGEIKTIDDFHSRFDYFNNISHPKDLETRNKALRIVERIITASFHLIISRRCALLAGALIESGNTDPTIVAQCIYDLFMKTIETAKPVLDEIAKNVEEEINEKLLEKMYPEAYYGWCGLKLVWLPFKAILVSSKTLRNDFKKNEVLLKFLREYQDSNNGCFWVFKALFIFEGEMLILHPQTKKGFRIFVKDIDNALIISHLLTKMLVRKDEKDFIPSKKRVGASQFWIYNWQAVKYFPEDYSKVTTSDLSHCSRGEHLGSGSFMTDITLYEKKLAVIIAVDVEFVWTFDIGPSFLELSPKIELVEILKQTTVDEWFEKFKSGKDINGKDDEEWREIGFDHYKKEEYDRAIDCFQKALEINPDNINAWNNMGNAYDEKGEYDRAIDCSQKAIEIDPDYAYAWNNMGNAHYEREEYDRAIDCFQKAIEINPLDVDTWEALGLSYRKIDKYENAINCFNNILELKPNNQWGLYRKAQNETLNNNLNDAFKTLKTLFGLNVDWIKDVYEDEDFWDLKDSEGFKDLIASAWGLDEFIEYYYNIGEEDLASVGYTKFLESNPTKSQLYDLGFFLSDGKDIEKAIECYKKGLELDPDYIDAWKQLGRIYKDIFTENKEEYENAVDCFKKVLEIKPDSYSALYNIGSLFANKAKLDDALKYYERAIKLKNAKYEVWFNKGLIHYKQEDYNEAIKCFERVILLDKRKLIIEDTWYMKARSEALNGNHEDAIESLKIAIKYDENIKLKAKKQSDFKLFKELEEFKKVIE